MQLVDFNVTELDANIQELKSSYETFANASNIQWPKRWVDMHKNNVDYVKRKELKQIYELNLNRYESARKVWFDGDGNVKPKYKSLLINFYGGILWLHSLLEKLYNSNSQE